MALQDDDAFTAVHDLAVCLFIPVFHGSAGGSIGALGVDQQLVEVGGVVVMRCRMLSTNSLNSRSWRIWNG